MTTIKIKRSFILIYLFFFFGISLICAQFGERPIVDSKLTISQNEEKSLIALGQLWGFLKYHHPAVAKGNYDWDKELIKLIPLIRETEEEIQWKEILDNWINSLPKVLKNPNKKLPDLEIKTKPDYGELFNSEYFLPKTIDKIKYILDNSVISTNYYYNENRKIRFKNEQSYEDLTFPELPYRLIALFRYWNIINYFFPYRELCDQKWSTILAEMLPEFIYAQNQEDYIYACLKLASKIDDSHGTLSINSNTFLLKNVGFLKTPFETQFIENQLVVTMFTGDDTYFKERIKIGDIITTIDGVSVETIVRRMLPYMPASNYAVKLRGISRIILVGRSKEVSLVVQRDGNSFDITIPRYDIRKLKIPDYNNPSPEKEGYTVMDNNIGYVLISNCTVKERDEGIMKVLNGTKGVIIDLRCYPKDDMAYRFVSSLKTQYTRIYHNICSYSNVSYPGYFFIPKGFKGIDNSKYRITPKIVVIVNEYAQSSAEDQVMVFQTVPNVVVIGSATAGASGSVTNFNLPGKIGATMTGEGVYYPDGTNLQRTGVKIDEIVKPTVEGIRTGRDELLERAIEIINEGI